jgi:hypothetical protein
MALCVIFVEEFEDLLLLRLALLGLSLLKARLVELEHQELLDARSQRERERERERERRERERERG